jgi:hypothetical protein
MPFLDGTVFCCITGLLTIVQGNDDRLNAIDGNGQSFSILEKVSLGDVLKLGNMKCKAIRGWEGSESKDLRCPWISYAIFDFKADCI